MLAEEGSNPTLIKWITDGSSLVSKTFTYPPSNKVFYDVIAVSRGWMEVTYKSAEFSSDEIRGRLAAFDGGAPAFGGTTTNTWNMSAIVQNNLMVRDKTGMAQTAGHEFFHAIQERLVGSNPGPGGEKIPNWFWEGPAMFVGLYSAEVIGAINSQAEGREYMLSRYRTGSAVTRGLALENVKANNSEVDPYAIGYAATEYLVALVGVEKFLQIYKELGQGSSFSSAFEDATGLNLEEFYSHFEEIRAGLGFTKS